MRPFEALSSVGAPHELERDERASDAEAWLAALSQAIPPALTNRFGIDVEGAVASSESWRQGVGALTPPTPAPAEGTAGAESQKGLLLRLDAGDLGEMQCHLEQGADGVRVLIGVDGRNAMTAAGAERSALEASLRAAGVEVRSIAVVPLAELGTVLAQRARADAHGQLLARLAAAGPRDSSRPVRRLKLIG